jgi:DNA helicase-2/ATP-dependent DNA helicase PcrA
MQRALAWTNQMARSVAAWMDGEKDADVRLDPEDDALLLRMYQLRVGHLVRPGARPLHYHHLVLDEVQDFSPVEVSVLISCTDERKSVTLAGDTRQHISTGGGFTSWTEFLGRIGVESTALNTLQVSYRSTHPITRFALDVLGDDDEPAPRTTRDGPPVELFRFSEHGAAVGFLAEELRRLLRAEPNANVAILTPHPELSRTYAQGLRHAEVPRVRLVVEQEFAFAPGVDVVEAREVKGLEFDYVVLVEVSALHYPDTPYCRRLLHVAATRAVHQLWLTCVGTPSPLLPEQQP